MLLPRVRRHCRARPVRVGITVFDPSVYAEAVAEVSHLIQQYNQLVQTYQMITNQYNQMVWMAKTLPGDLANFRAIRTPMVPVIGYQHLRNDRGLDRCDQ